MQKLIIVYGGDLAQSVAEQILSKKPSTLSDVSVSLRNASDRPKTLLENGEDTIICFVMQTIENESPTEDGGSCVRFFKRKTHPEDLLKGKFLFCVLGLGDSNLLLDRQTTTAKDCNQVAQQLDSRLYSLGGKRIHELGMADERHGLEEVEPWIDSFWTNECFNK